MTTLIPNPSAMSRHTESGKESQNLVKLVVFPMGSLTLALPMKAISRVINMPEVHGSGLSPVGVTTVGNLQLTIIDLHRQLFQVSAPQRTGKGGYLIILPTSAGFPIGIPTAETPLLTDVPTGDIRALPEAYRQADTLSIASHLTRITLESGETQSVFLLDVAAVLASL